MKYYRVVDSMVAGRHTWRRNDMMRGDDYPPHTIEEMLAKGRIVLIPDAPGADRGAAPKPESAPKRAADFAATSENLKDGPPAVKEEEPVDPAFTRTDDKPVKRTGGRPVKKR